MKINAELVLKLRKAKAWSQEELAIASGLNLRTIQRIEKEATASLQSKKSLASALDINIQDLDKENDMKPCPECNSNEIYQFNGSVDTTTIGGELLPKLSSSLFSSARITPVICSECGYLRYYVTSEALDKLEKSKQWSQI